MKKALAILAAGASLAVLAGAPAVVAAPKAKTCAAIKAVDPDNDGTMDLAEAKAAAGKLFDKLNKDKAKDSTLDAKELKGRLSAKELKAADPDKDGTIDKAEYLAVVEARFKAANPDGDGTIECKELGTKAGKALLKLLK